MKKNRMMRLASGLLVAVLVTTSMISGTFAKYTTQDSASDVARVAKWGVELQVVGDLYGENYVTGTNTATTSSTGISVQGKDVADSAENVVAPGTKNDEAGLSFTLNGTPEVMTTVTTKIVAQNIYLGTGHYGVLVEVPANKVTDANYADLKDELYILDNGKYVKAGSSNSSAKYYTLEDAVNVTSNYYPVVYKLNSTATTDTTDTDGTWNTDSMKEVSETIMTGVKGSEITLSDTDLTNGVLYTKTVVHENIAPNTDMNTLGLSGTNLAWEWAFDNDGCGIEGNDVNKTKYGCGADTILGYMFAENRDPKATSEVVYSTDGTNYVAVTYVNVDKNEAAGINAYSYVTDGTNTIASLTTQFGIDITVTQVD